MNARSSPGSEADWLVTNPPQRTRAERYTIRSMWACGIGCAIVAALALAGLVWLGLSMESGYLPDSKAVPGERVAARFRAYLIEQGLLEPDEEIIYLYADGIFHVREGCTYFTDRRVVTFSDGSMAAEARREVVTYPEIEDIRATFEEGWMADSRIDVDLVDGRTVTLLVCNDEGGDRQFEARLQVEWLARRLGLEKR